MGIALKLTRYFKAGIYYDYSFLNLENFTFYLEDELEFRNKKARRKLDYYSKDKSNNEYREMRNTRESFKVGFT